MMTNPTTTLTELIRGSSQPLIFTGAGISTDSGIPDFRGPQGVWKTRQPVYYQDFMNRDDARLEYWEYKLESWQLYRKARPNAVHEAIVRLQAARKGLMVVTQNVDGLHAMAGTPEAMLVEVHGTDREIECQSCGDRTEPGPHFEQFSSTRVPPICRCGGVLKPATISFGQPLREVDIRRALDAARACDLVIALGSTLSVHPAAGIPLAAAESGAAYAIINRGETDHDHLPSVKLRIEGSVADHFPAAVTAALA